MGTVWTPSARPNDQIVGGFFAVSTETRKNAPTAADYWPAAAGVHTKEQNKEEIDPK